MSHLGVSSKLPPFPDIHSKSSSYMNLSWENLIKTRRGRRVTLQMAQFVYFKHLFSKQFCCRSVWFQAIPTRCNFQKKLQSIFSSPPLVIALFWDLHLCRKCVFIGSNWKPKSSISRSLNTIELFAESRHLASVFMRWFSVIKLESSVSIKCTVFSSMICLQNKLFSIGEQIVHG